MDFFVLEIEVLYEAPCNIVLSCAGWPDYLCVVIAVQQV